MKKTYIISLMVFLVSCSAKENAPANIFPESKMKSVLWDVMRVQTLAQHNAREDSTINLNAETTTLTEKVFEIHKVTSKDFDRSYNWYTSHPDQMQLLLDSLYAQKQREFNPEPSDTIMKGRKLLKPLITEKSITDE